MRYINLFFFWNQGAFRKPIWGISNFYCFKFLIDFKQTVIKKNTYSYPEIREQTNVPHFHHKNATQSVVCTPERSNCLEFLPQHTGAATSGPKGEELEISSDRPNTKDPAVEVGQLLQFRNDFHSTP